MKSELLSLEHVFELVMGVLGWLAHGLKHDVKNVLIKLALLLHSFLNVLLLLLAFAHFDCDHVPNSSLFVVH